MLMLMTLNFYVMYVPVDLVGELFPERKKLWENLMACADKLRVFVSYTTDRYIQLYLSLTGYDKHAALLLRWLENSYASVNKLMGRQQLLKRHLGIVVQVKTLNEQFWQLC